MVNFVVGLNNLVNKVKQILIYNKGVNMVGLKGLGASLEIQFSCAYQKNNNYGFKFLVPII